MLTMKRTQASEAAKGEDFMTLLERHMRARGLTQTALAAKLDVHPSAISKWKSGEDVPAPKRMKKLARLLGVTALKLTELIEASESPALPSR